MTNKDKSISFRITEDQFNELRRLAETLQVNLSTIFREYVDDIIEQDGRINLVPEHESIRAHSNDSASNAAEFPPTLDVPKSFIRDHERLKLECEHLRDEIDEYSKHIQELESKLEANKDYENNMTRLENIDFENGSAIRVEETSDLID